MTFCILLLKSLAPLKFLAKHEQSILTTLKGPHQPIESHKLLSFQLCTIFFKRIFCKCNIFKVKNCEYYAINMFAICETNQSLLSFSVRASSIPRKNLSKISTSKLCCSVQAKDAHPSKFITVGASNDKLLNKIHRTQSERSAA